MFGIGKIRAWLENRGWLKPKPIVADASNKGVREQQALPQPPVPAKVIEPPVTEVIEASQVINARTEFIGTKDEERLAEVVRLAEVHLRKGELLFAQYYSQDIRLVLAKGSIVEDLELQARGVLDGIDILCKPIDLKPGDATKIEYTKPIQIGPNLWIADIYDSPLKDSPIFNDPLTRLLARMKQVKVFVVMDTASYEGTKSNLGIKSMAEGSFIVITPEYVFESEIKVDETMKEQALEPGGKDKIATDRFSPDSVGKEITAIICFKNSFLICKPTAKPAGQTVVRGTVPIYRPFSSQDKKVLLLEIFAMAEQKGLLN